MTINNKFKNQYIYIKGAIKISNKIKILNICFSNI